jgi:hypothetical protein
MPNAFDLECPVCFHTDLDVHALVWVQLTETGSDADTSHDGSHEWDDNSLFFCRNCEESGAVAWAKTAAEVKRKHQGK